MKKDIYDKTIDDFGDEWNLYQYTDQDKEIEKIFNEYFDIFPWDKNKNAKLNCLDLGCGTGRWSKVLSKYVKHITMLDPSSKAMEIARKNLKNVQNVNFISSKFEEADFQDNSFDFIFSLGVLHHMDNILDKMKKINRILSPDGFALIYLYYRFDNKSIFFKISPFFKSL